MTKTTKAKSSDRRVQGSRSRRRVSPFKEMGVSGTAIWGGFVQSNELDTALFGQQKWTTFSDIVANTSIVGAGTRHFLNLIAFADWSLEAPDVAGAEEAAEFAEDVMHDMRTSWSRIVRRAALYRFNGFGVQEWTAKRRKQDGKIGFDDIEARPSHTIERWELDPRGSVLGMYQRSPQTSEELFLPRNKVIYLVDDVLTDSPEGMGLFRHLVEPARRLKRYLDLEGSGFERDFRGIPIGRVPYQAMNQAVSDGVMTKEQMTSLTSVLENFVQCQAKDINTSLVLDSATYTSQMEAGKAISSVPQWGIELLTGGSSGFADAGKAIERINRELARSLGVEQIMLGDGSGGSRALSEDKSRSLYQTVNSTLDEIGDALDRDVLGPLWRLNGFPDETRPVLKHSDVSFRSVQEITASLRDMATAGAVLSPDDPVINDVRDRLGAPHAPEMSPEDAGMLPGNTDEPTDEPPDDPGDDLDDDELVSEAG